MNTWAETLESKCRYLQEIQDFKLNPTGYALFHIDGKNFSSLTKKFKRPFDNNFIEAMNQAALELCEEISGTKVAFVQSDEITLVVSFRNEEGFYIDPWYGGRLWKLCSLGGDTASNAFNKYFIDQIANTPASAEDLKAMLLSYKWAKFDCKVWTVSNASDAYAWLSFRSIDCIRNSKQQTAQSCCSHKELLGKHTDEQVEIAKTKGVDWNTFSDGEKYGRLLWKEPQEVIGQSGTPVIRNKWKTHPGFPLIGPEGYEKFNSIITL